MTTSKSLGKAFFLWGLANIFFAFQFILRLSAGILREEIIEKFAIDAAAFGSLAGSFYLGYAGMQIPLGIMLDRLSFRFVTFMAVATAAIGTLTFISTDNWQYVLIGRFLIGTGSGVAFLSIVKITKTYFAPKNHSLMIGLAFSFGLLGAVFGVTPMKMLFDHFGYDDTFKVLTIACFTIAFAMLFFGRIEEEQNEEEQRDVFMQVLQIMANPKILLIGICGGLMVGSLEGFADVWAIPFFNQVYGVSAYQSGVITSFVYIGMCFGGPILALSASKMGSNNFMIFLTGIFTIIIFLILFYAPALSFTHSMILMFILGILCCYQVLVFTVVSNYVASSSAALAIAVTNCINMSFGYFFHTIIGHMIETSWSGTLTDGGGAIYGRDDFIISLAVIPICCFIGQFGFAYLALKGRKISNIEK